MSVQAKADAAVAASKLDSIRGIPKWEEWEAMWKLWDQ